MLLGRAAHPADVRRASNQLRVRSAAPAAIAERILASKAFFDDVNAIHVKAIRAKSRP
jgi:hypothetical protein